MADNGTVFEIQFDTKSLDAALKKIETATDGLVKKLDAGFGILDARIGLMRSRLVAIQDQIGISGDTFSNFLKMFGEIFESGEIEVFGKELAKLTHESAQAERNITKFSLATPETLLTAFKELVSLAAALRAATEERVSVFGVDEDRAAVLTRQEQLVRGLIRQSESRQKRLQEQINLEASLGRFAPNANFETRGVSRERRRELEETLQTLRDIAKFADEPRVKALIEDALDFQMPSRQQRGALEPREPRRRQLASSGVGPVSDANGVNDLAAAQSTLTDAVERSGGALNEQAGTLRDLDGVARDLGFTFASSFEDAVVEGRRLSDVLQGLEQDILRILTRKRVTEPLAGAPFCLERFTAAECPAK